MFMKKRRAAELLAEMHRPPTPPSSDQESDGDTETKLPRLSSSKEEDKMLAKVRLGPTLFMDQSSFFTSSCWWSSTTLSRPAQRLPRQALPLE